MCDRSPCFSAQVLQRMSAINGSHPAHRIKLISHQSHHLATPLHTQHAATDNSSSGQGPDMSWQHAHGTHSQHHRISNASSSGNRPDSGGLQPTVRSNGASVGGQGSRRQDRQQQQQQDWKRQQRQCCRSSWSTARLLLQQPLRRRFLPLLVAWLGLCGGWYSTVRVKQGMD